MVNQVPLLKNLAAMFDIETPIISLVIGEGGSGGALGIAIADRVLMMEYSIYSVILLSLVPLFFGQILKKVKQQRMLLISA